MNTRSLPLRKAVALSWITVFALTAQPAATYFMNIGENKMARNIEIKARVPNPEILRERTAALCGSRPEVIRQEDTFFRVPCGRLKLREVPHARAQLISYERQDGNGPKLSNYHICETDTPDVLKSILSTVLGVRGVVRKERHLFMTGQTRIHLDQVVELGHFLELEVVLRPDQSETDGERIARDLMARLDIRECDLIEGAYIDLLEVAAGNVPPFDS